MFEHLGKYGISLTYRNNIYKNGIVMLNSKRSKIGMAENIYEPTQKKRDLMLLFYLSVFLIQSPMWATDMRFCLKLSQGLYYMSANWRDCACAQAHLSLFWSSF